MMNFNDAINKAKEYQIENKKIILLLGNGFSKSCCVSNKRFNSDFNYNFNYRYLMKVIKSDPLPNGEPLENLFDTLNTTNFEYVLQSLNNTNEIIRLLNIKPDSDIIDQYYKKIQTLLINSINKVHPAHQYEIHENSYQACEKFLKNFNVIFTLNYDLLLYWAIRTKVNLILKRRFSDGFSIKETPDSTVCIWNEDEKSTIHYLHGALHLFKKDGDNICKLINKGKDKKLIERINNKINKSSYPIFVAEGNHLSKLTQIEENSYLTSSLNSLKKCNGILFTYGVSFNNDEHILETISKNKKIKDIYVGCFNNDNEPYNKCKGLKKNIIKYDASSIEPWG